MTKKVSFCYNHPTTISRRKCFHCGKPLCPKCQHRLSRHIFCGDLCHSRYKRALFFRKLREIKGLTIWKTAFYVTAVIVLLAIGIIHFMTKTETKSVPPEVESNGDSLPGGIAADWTAAGEIEITTPKYGEATDFNPITTSGTAPDGAIVGLYLNSDLIGLTLCKDGIFTFKNIKLPDEHNILQARFFDDRGNNFFSGAVLVTYKGKEYKKPEVIVPEKEVYIAKGASDNIIRGNRQSHQVFFTFDGGSSDKGTTDLLNILAEKKIYCTIFLTGTFIENYPDLTRRIVQDGHEVGNHTFSHPHLTTYYGNRRHNTLDGVTREFLQSQLQRTADLFEEVTGTKMAPFWRAPFGEHNREIRSWASELGYKHIYWSMDSLDWVADKSSEIYYTPTQIKARVMNFSRSSPPRGGEIILMHLSVERGKQDNILTVLSEMIDELKEKGYRFEKISSIQR